MNLQHIIKFKTQGSNCTRVGKGKGVVVNELVRNYIRSYPKNLSQTI